MSHSPPATAEPAQNELDFAAETFTDNLTPNDPPIIKERSGDIGLAIFANEIEKKDGSMFITYNVVIDRSFKNGDEWKRTRKLRAQDLLKLAEVAQRAWSAPQNLIHVL